MEAPGLRDEPRSVGIVTDSSGLVGSLTRGHKRPREHGVTWFFKHRVRLTSKQGFIHHEAVGRAHHPVHHQLVAAAQINEVIQHQFIPQHRYMFARSYHRGF